NFLPQGLERIEVALDAARLRKRLDTAEAALELGGGAAQCGFRLDVELAREVGRGEQQVADLFFERRRRCVVIERVFDLVELLLDLVDDRSRVRPVEADARGAA